MTEFGFFFFSSCSSASWMFCPLSSPGQGPGTLLTFGFSSLLWSSPRCRPLPAPPSLLPCSLPPLLGLPWFPHLPSWSGSPLMGGEPCECLNGGHSSGFFKPFCLDRSLLGFFPGRRQSEHNFCLFSCSVTGRA